MIEVTLMHEEEAQLIRRAQAGDRQAFAGIYDRYQEAIFTYLYYRVSDQHTAEDLTADVFVKVVEKIGSYRDRGRPFLAWLYTIARNLLTDHYRQAGQLALLPLKERIIGTTTGPAKTVEHHLATDCLRQALNHLTEAQKQVIIGKFVEDRSNREVAVLLGKTEGAVKSLQHRALNALRRAIEKEGCYEP
jgi:RNA polymerase sigma-70 factor (ECF subfamily)